jgi:hypothetical protein
VPINVSLKAELNSIPVVTKGVPRKTFKSDRDYELGIVYLDDYGRMTTVLTSDGNTVHVPASASTAQNLLKVKVNNYAPCFATKYRFFIKQNKSEYYNVFPVDYFQDGLYTWFLIHKADIDKVQKDAYLTIKSTESGPTGSAERYKIIEADMKAINFLNNPPTTQPEGFYIKIKSEGTLFTKIARSEKVFENKGKANNRDTFFPEVSTLGFKLSTSQTYEADEKHAYDYTFEVWER